MYPHYIICTAHLYLLTTDSMPRPPPPPPPIYNVCQTELQSLIDKISKVLEFIPKPVDNIIESIDKNSGRYTLQYRKLLIIELGSPIAKQQVYLPQYRQSSISNTGSYRSEYHKLSIRIPEVINFKNTGSYRL